MSDRGSWSVRELAGRAGRVVRDRRDRRGGSMVVLGLTFALLVALPDLLDVSVFGVRPVGMLSVHLLTVTLIWAVAAQSWNVVSGFAGQFSFGHVAFFGLGAYTPLVLAREFAVNPWVGMAAGSALAAAYAACIGVLSFRYDVRGSYFALITLAFAELLLYVFVNVERLGGASGFVKPLPGAYGAEFGLRAFQFRETRPYYYVVLGFLVVVTLVAVAVRRSRVGLHLAAIREDESAAAAVGVPTFRYKLFALVLSAALTAWAGTFWAMYFTSIRPRVVFGVLVNLDILLPAVVGGLGTVLGPIVGALALTVVNESARQAVDVPQLQGVVYAVLLLVVVLWTPGGIVSLPGRFADRFRERLPHPRSGPDPTDDD